MLITSSGIQVFYHQVKNLDYPAYNERISSGVTRLDAMLNGGYLRGSSILMTGAPGTAKSTMAAAFLEAACKRGENAIYISFDEGVDEIARNMESVGIDLSTQIQSGRLKIYSIRAAAYSSMEHLIYIQSLLEEYQPQCLVIDPLLALIQSGGQLNAIDVAQRLIFLTKSRSITCIMTSLLDTKNPETESSPMQVSTIADTWIHLSFIIKAGERNRALTIIKARGTRHSNQVRELVLSDEGITLSDIYTKDCYDVEVVDILDDPFRPIRDGILATPTLIKLYPSPVIQLWGTQEYSQANRRRWPHLAPGYRRTRTGCGCRTPGRRWCWQSCPPSS